MHSSDATWWKRLQAAQVTARLAAGAWLVDGFFNGLSRVGRLHPSAAPEKHGVEVIRDVAYDADGAVAHRLDVYRPIERGRKWPVVFYVHGGGFRILSKDSHWSMALTFARRGYAVFNINYRLAPQHPFPAALADTCAAYEWVVRHAAEYGADAERIIVAGESAGGNLITALTLATCQPRSEPYARRVFDVGAVPAVALPACAMLQVSGRPTTTWRGPIGTFFQDRLNEVETAYLHGLRNASADEVALANPLLVLENGFEPARPLPPFCAVVGTLDPLLDDTRRLKAALDRLGVPCQAHYYRGELHAFHAFVMRQAAVQCWRDIFTFVEAHHGPSPLEAPWPLPRVAQRG